MADVAAFTLGDTALLTQQQIHQCELLRIFPRRPADFAMISAGGRTATARPPALRRNTAFTFSNSYIHMICIMWQDLSASTGVTEAGAWPAARRIPDASPACPAAHGERPLAAALPIL